MYDIFILLDFDNPKDEFNLIENLRYKNLNFRLLNDDCNEFYEQCLKEKPRIIVVDSLFILENWGMDLKPNPCVIFASKIKEKINEIPERFRGSIEIIEFSIGKLIGAIENMTKRKKCNENFLSLLAKVRTEYENNKYLTELIVELFKSTEGHEVDVSLSNDDEYEYDAFISHSSKDNEFVKGLANRLSGNNINIWYDELMDTGENIVPAIDVSLKKCRKILVISSANSESSNWVSAEANYILKNDPTNKENRLIVLNIDNYKLSGIAGGIIGINYDTKNSSEGFVKLIEQLNIKRKIYKIYRTLKEYRKEEQIVYLLECWNTKKPIGDDIIKDMERKITESDGCDYGIMMSWNGFTKNAELEIAKFAMKKIETKQMIIPIRSKDIVKIIEEGDNLEKIMDENREKILLNAFKA